MSNERPATDTEKRLSLVLILGAFILVATVIITANGKGMMGAVIAMASIGCFLLSIIYGGSGITRPVVPGRGNWFNRQVICGIFGVLAATPLLLLP
jgi:hypothetical protein